MADITFHTVKPVAIRDLLSSESLPIRDRDAAQAHVPCGLSRFLDIEIKGAL